MQDIHVAIEVDQFSNGALRYIDIVTPALSYHNFREVQCCMTLPLTVYIKASADTAIIAYNMHPFVSLFRPCQCEWCYVVIIHVGRKLLAVNWQIDCSQMLPHLTRDAAALGHHPSSSPYQRRIAILCSHTKLGAGYCKLYWPKALCNTYVSPHYLMQVVYITMWEKTLQ